MDESRGSKASAEHRREVGPTAVVACRADPRFSYCLYVPADRIDDRTPAELIVAVHGSARYFQSYRDAFAEFCRWNDCIVLAPLFPVGVRGDDNGDGYKYLVEGEIRYDRLLLAMVDEVARAYGCASERFALFGYSGGGHFAHRFFITHPSRLWAVSIGAPGNVTLLDRDRDWWLGVRNLPDVFGAGLDLEAMRKVPVQMIVGAGDIEPREITQPPGAPYWMPGANDNGRTRQERLRKLEQSFGAHGIAVRFEIVPDVGHEAMRCIPPAREFFAHVLRQCRSVNS